MAAAQQEPQPESTSTGAEQPESASVDVEQPSVTAPEAQTEQREQREQQPAPEADATEAAETAQATAQRQAAQQAATQRPQKDPLTRQIEGVLQDGLTDLYSELPPDTQQAFRQKGEETASKIRTMMREAKVQAKKVFDLIADWLGLIPRVNRYYLIQEAKIKTDNILTLAGQAREEEEERIA